MTPLSVAHTELRLFVQQLEHTHHALTQADKLRRAAGWPASLDGWEDLRTAALAELWETLDRIEPGLGLRLMKALFPVFVPGDEDDDANDGAPAATAPTPAPHDPHWEAGA